MQGTTDDRNPDKRSDIYNDAAVSPIGRLMDDKNEPSDEPSAYVSGFERGKPPEDHPPERRPVRRQRETREPQPAPPEPYPSDNFYEMGVLEANARRTTRDRSTSEPNPDEDFFELGVREARKERERRRPPNPDPKPAVRATVPTQRRMNNTSQSPPRRNETYSGDQQPEDSYDTFRKRYNPDELISASRGGEPVRRGDGAVRSFSPQPMEDDERINPIRVAIMGVAAAFLLLLIILVVSLTRTIGQRNDLQEIVDAGNEYQSQYNNLRADFDFVSSQLETRTTERDHYRSLALQPGGPGTATDPGYANNYSSSDSSDSAHTISDDFPREHLVVRGDNLTRIARLHYGIGRDTLRYQQHIMAYNNMRTDVVHLDTTIRIPAPPPAE